MSKNRSLANLRNIMPSSKSNVAIDGQINILGDPQASIFEKHFVQF